MLITDTSYEDKEKKQNIQNWYQGTSYCAAHQRSAIWYWLRCRFLEVRVIQTLFVMEYSFYSFIILAWSPYFSVFCYFFRSRHLPSVHSLIVFMTFKLILGTLANHLKVQLRNMSTAHLTSLELAILKSCHQIVKLIYKLLRSDHHWKYSSLNKKITRQYSWLNKCSHKTT